MSKTGREPNGGPEIRNVKGQSGISYLVFRSNDGNFHVFREVDAMKAAEDCGAVSQSSGRKMWETIWEAQLINESITNTKGKEGKSIEYARSNQRIDYGARK